MDEYKTLTMLEICMILSMIISIFIFPVIVYYILFYAKKSVLHTNKPALIRLAIILPANVDSFSKCRVKKILLPPPRNLGGPSQLISDNFL